MPQQPLPRDPFHIGEQSASALLGPAEAELDVVATRLAHYVERLRMPDADRQVIARAQRTVETARAELARLRADAGKSAGETR